MDNYEDIIKELKKAERMGLFNTQTNQNCKDNVVNDIFDSNSDLLYQSKGVINGQTNKFEGTTSLITNILSTIPLPAAFKNNQGIYTFVNDSFCELIGKQSSEIIGKSDYKVYSEDEANKQRLSDKQLLKNKQIKRNISKEITFDNANKQSVSVNKTPVYNDDGKPLGIVIILQDNTEQTKIENKLRENERKYRELFNNSLVGINVHNADGSIHSVNKTAEEIFGYSENELKEKDLHFWEGKLFKANGEPMEMSEYPLSMASKLKKPYEGEIIGLSMSDNEKIRWFLLGARPILKKNGEIEKIVTSFVDITNQKKAEEALRKAEKKYRNLFLNAQVGLFRTDLVTGKMLETNDALASFAGYESREALLADNFNIAEHYVDPNQRQEMISQLKKHGEIRNYEAQFKRRDGLIRWIRFSARISQDKKSIEGVSEDFTNEKKAKEALRNSEERFRNMAELLPEAIVETNKDLQITYANNQAFKMMGYTKNDFSKGINGFESFLPEEHKRVKENLERRIKGESLGLIEYQAVKKNGTSFPVLLHAEPIIKQKEFQGLRAVIIDITERKKVEKKLKEEEKKYRMYIDNAPFGIFVIDKQGTFHEVNDAASNITGYKKSELIDKNFVEMSTLEDKEKITHHLQRLNETNFTSGSYQFVRKDESVQWLSINTVKLSDNRYLCFTNDISEIKEKEEKLNEKIDELKRWKKVTVDRELKMVELKKEIAKLKKR